VSIEEVKATIRGGIEAIDEAETVIASVRDKLRSTRSSAAATTHGSTHETIQRGLRTLAQADYEAELTLRRLNASTAAAGGYLGLVG
jgi:predicted phage gp36 major capsid-like protein